jgi:hypothetical protein
MRRKIKSTDGSTDTPGALRKSSHNAERKTLGTRVGILRDWREASGRTAKDSGLRRDRIRDGR